MGPNLLIYIGDKLASCWSTGAQADPAALPAHSMQQLQCTADTSHSPHCSHCTPFNSIQPYWGLGLPTGAQTISIKTDWGGTNNYLSVSANLCSDLFSIFFVCSPGHSWQSTYCDQGLGQKRTLFRGRARGRNVAAADIRSLRGSHGWDVTLQGLHRATLTYLLRAVYADCMQSVHPAVRAAVHWAEQKLSIFLQHLIPVQSAEWGLSHCGWCGREHSVSVINSSSRFGEHLSF